MYETVVTVVGNVAAVVDRRQLPDGTVVTNFPLISTQRRYDKTAGRWVDGDRFHVDVTCWRGLAENVAASIEKGDPVVVTGRMYTRSYEHDGRRHWRVTLEAQSVGPDLTWCTAAVNRTRRRTATDTDGAGPASPDAGSSAGSHGAAVAAAPALVGAVPGAEG